MAVADDLAWCRLLAVDHRGTTATTASRDREESGSQSLTVERDEDSGWLSMSPMSGNDSGQIAEDA